MHTTMKEGEKMFSICCAFSSHKPWRYMNLWSSFKNTYLELAWLYSIFTFKVVNYHLIFSLLMTLEDEKGSHIKCLMPMEKALMPRS